jgi:tetratricopeptide (TPR) repeat protein
MRPLLLSAAVVVCLSASVTAQSPPPPGNAPQAAPAAADAAFSLERLYTRVRFENDGGMRREATYWVKVLDEHAVRRFGEFPLVYQSETEDLTITDIAVQKPDGTVTPTPTDRVQDVSALPGPAPMFIDVRQKIISVTALRPGDVLRVTAVWTIKKPIAPGQFWFEYSFDDTDVVRDEQLELDVPADRAIALKIAPTAAAEEHSGAGAVSGGRRVYRWHTSHVQTNAVEPIVQPGDDQPAADVRLSSFKSWDEFAHWFTPLAFAKPDSTVKAKAAALTAGAADDAAKTAAIYRFVSTEIRYLSLSFGLGRFAAHAPADVLKNQYGDCKDKTVLLGALLDAAGLRSLPVLLNTQHSISEDFASPLEFNHMIAMMPGTPHGAEATWMDSTTEVAPIGMLARPSRGKSALLLDGTGRATVIRTPVDPPLPMVDDISLSGSVNTIGVLSAKVTTAFRSDAELALRIAVRAIPRSDLKDFANVFANAYGLNGEVSEASTSDPADTSEPFRLSFTIRCRGTLNWAADRSDVKIPLKLELEDGKPDDRKGLHKIWLGSPGIVRVRASIELPDRYEAAAAPAAVSLSRAGVSYTSSYTVEGRHMTLQRELKTVARDVPESAFGEYTALASAIAADSEQPFKIRGSVTDTPMIPSDATPLELYDAGQHAWEADRYADAAAIYKRATELDPKMGDAWIALGLAYGRLKRYEDAEAALRQEIGLNPYDKRAYSDLGYVLKTAGKESDAATAYAKHVELNPLDGAAFKELGNLYADLNRSADEAAAFEKAAALLKPDAWIFADLGAAYIALKNADKARWAFSRALELESTPAMWTKVSWQLAEGDVDLDRAEELGRQSEKQILAEDLDLKSVTNRQLSQITTLAWTWDALGWIRFQRGDLIKAEEYSRAAWLLGGFPRTAWHLAQIAEKRDKLSDALSYSLTAKSLMDHPLPEITDRIKHLSGGADMTSVLAAARRMSPSDRIVKLASKTPAAPAASATFLVMVDNQHKAVDLRFEDGDDSVRSAETALRAATYSLNVPGDVPTRLVVRVTVACDAEQVCIGLIAYPDRVKLKK